MKSHNEAECWWQHLLETIRFFLKILVQLVNLVPLSNNPFHKGILGTQTTGPQTTN